MSLESSQPGDDSPPAELRKFGIRGADSGVGQGTVVQGTVERRPTFTAPVRGPATSLGAAPAKATPPGGGQAVPAQAAGARPDGQSGQQDGKSGRDDRTQPAPASASGPSLSSPAVGGAAAPLLGDVVGLRANWQRTQAGFVDDPQAAVADAAELVEHTAQALVGALQQHQRQLRAQWERGSAGAVSASGSGEADTASANGQPDTEQLRRLMQRYRALFNQICRS